ncbi:MAG: hypothetical protein QOF71_2037 [Candidatus Eremiobacteraeota bacterium]|jgi:hypothetical protein|nr:hypothetical protein [Candidatus Eremiobacteraeota bacterium]
MTQPPSVESVFSRAWTLLSSNWIIIVPGVVIGVIVGIIHGLLTPHVYTAADYQNNPSLAMASVGGAFMRAILMAGVGVLGYIATTAYTVGMAGAAWERGTTTLADGSAAFQERSGNVVMTAIGLILLGIVAAVLAIPTITLSLLAFWIFTLYAMPAAVIGNQPGFSAIGQSFQIATKRFVPTLIIAILIAVISFVLGLLTLPLHFIPFLGPIVSAVITQIVIAFAMLVIVGEYLSLRNQGTIASPYQGAPPPPPSYPTGGPTA